jgi:hypothetical protein
VDQAGIVLDVLVQRRRSKQAAKRLLRKPLKKQMRPPRVMITYKLASYGAAKREVMPGIVRSPLLGRRLETAAYLARYWKFESGSLQGESGTNSFFLAPTASDIARLPRCFDVNGNRLAGRWASMSDSGILKVCPTNI